MLEISEKQDLPNKLVVRKWLANCKRMKLHLFLNTNGPTSQMVFKNESIRTTYRIIIFVGFFVVVVVYKLGSGEGFISTEMLTDKFD